MSKRSKKTEQVKIPWNLFESLDIRIEEDDGPEEAKSFSFYYVRTSAISRTPPTWGIQAPSCPSSSPASSSPTPPALCQEKDDDNNLRWTWPTENVVQMNKHSEIYFQTCQGFPRRPTCGRSPVWQSHRLPAGSLGFTLWLWSGKISKNVMKCWKADLLFTSSVIAFSELFSPLGILFTVRDSFYHLECRLNDDWILRSSIRSSRRGEEQPDFDFWFFFFLWRLS